MTSAPIAAVPLCDIRGNYMSLQPQLDEAVLRVLHSGMAILGPEVSAFESEFAAYCGAKFAVSCGSGTDALLLALHALDIGPGDEVILPPFTFFATLGSILRVGAVPVFAEIDPLTYNLDPDLLERKVTPRTKAIMPVHLFGQCADMAPICEIAERYGLHIIEDAAQSHGATYGGKMCGTLGAVSSFSFYPSKNLGTLGDGGAVTTQDEAMYKKMIALRNHGSEVKYYHKYIGWNGRMDALHAAMLRVKLPYSEQWIAARRAAAANYDQLIEKYSLNGFFQRPVVKPTGRHTFNQYVVRVPEQHRDPLVKYLKAENVGCEIYYPLSLHQQECIKHLGHTAGDFPVSEAAAASVLAFPMFPEITDAQQRRVLDVCAAYVQQSIKRAA